MNRKLSIFVIFVLLIISIFYYEVVLCKSGKQCITSEGFSVSMLCNQNLDEIDCDSINMYKYGDPKYDNISNEWCQGCRGSEPRSCHNPYPLCFTD